MSLSTHTRERAAILDDLSAAKEFKKYLGGSWRIKEFGWSPPSIVNICAQAEQRGIEPKIDKFERDDGWSLQPGEELHNIVDSFPNGAVAH